MTTFGFPSPELEVTIKFRTLSVGHCTEFVSKFKDLPTNQYIFNVLAACVSNIDSEVRPAMARLSPAEADQVLMSMYNCCVMLNPVLDVETWTELSRSYNMFEHDLTRFSAQDEPSFDHFMLEYPETVAADATINPPTKFKLGKVVLNTLQRALKNKVVGQNYPIELLFNALRRHQVGLTDAERPIGVFMFAGPSGVGKTLIAELLNNHLFGGDRPLLKINCGEFQHKHENSRLLGSPPGYIGHDDAGMLAKMVQNGGGNVILLDEAEKAHPDFWDTFLNIFDKGEILDSKGNMLNFRNSIFIITSNLGNERVSDATYGAQPGFGRGPAGSQYDSKATPKRELVERITNEEIRKYFKPELINRIDEIIIFNHLSPQDYLKIADLQFKITKQKLSNQEYNLEWTKRAIQLLVDQSSKAMEGARGMAKIRRKLVEDRIAELLYTEKFPAWKTFKVDAKENQFIIE